MSAEIDTPAGWLREARVRVVQDEAGHTRIRLQGMSPFWTFVSTIAVAAVACGFAYPLAAMVCSPGPVPPWLCACTIVLIILAALLLALRRLNTIAAGREDLVIDDAARTLSLPWGFGRSSETVIDIDQVVVVAPATEHGADAVPGMDTHALGPQTYRMMRASLDDSVPDTGHRGEVHFAVLVGWRFEEETGAVISPIARWSELKRARALTFWLRGRLGLPLSDDDAVTR